jgi:ketosteroid isomerase-like protein
VSAENVEIARRASVLAAESIESDEVERRLTDAALGKFFGTDIEWIPAKESPLATNEYHGYEGVRRFWAELLSIWDWYRAEPRDFLDAGDQVVEIMRLVGETHGVEIDEVWSALWTLRDARVVRVQGFASHDGALEAAGLSD